MDEKSKKYQLIVKITCFITAFGLWLYISNLENPISTYRLSNVPVKLINTEALAQSKLALLPGSQQTVTLTLRGRSADFALIKSEQFSLVADLGAYVLKKGEVNIPVQVVNSPKEDNVKILNSNNLWIKINLDEYVEKTVPIKVLIEEGVKPGYYALQPQLKLLDALVEGPSKYVNRVDNVVAKCNIKNAVSDVTNTLPLQAVTSQDAIINEVKINPQVVDVVVPVKKVKTVGINIKTKGNLNKNNVLKSLESVPNKIDIAGNEDVLRNINSIDTQPVDLDKLSASGIVNTTLIVPHNVKLINSDGNIKVNVTIESIDKVVEKNLALDVNVKNLSDIYDITMDNLKVNVVVSGFEETINNIKESDIICYIDASSLKEGENSVKVNLELPAGINKVSISPDTVKVVLKKKG